MASVNIPKEGLKLVCVAGHYNGNPIWRTVGTARVSGKGKLLISLDRTFNPAGIAVEDNSATALLHAVEFSPEDLAKKQSYSRESSRPSRKQYDDDFGDDIPF